MTEDLRQAIRSILLEELAAHGVRPPVAASDSRVEEVEINSDRDLQNLVRRILSLSRNEAARADIESGRHVFRLRQEVRGAAPSIPPKSQSRGGALRIDKGLITEKHVRDFPDGVSVVKVNSGVCLTPLANDAMRRAGIKIEKVKS